MPDDAIYRIGKRNQAIDGVGISDTRSPVPGVIGIAFIAAVTGGGIIADRDAGGSPGCPVPGLSKHSILTIIVPNGICGFGTGAGGGAGTGNCCGAGGSGRAATSGAAVGRSGVGTSTC